MVSGCAGAEGCVGEVREGWEERFEVDHVSEAAGGAVPDIAESWRDVGGWE